MHYTVKASSLRVRARAGLNEPILRVLPHGAAVETDWITFGPLVTGWDDPETPEPARASRAWVHLVDGGWVAEAWLDPVRNADGFAV